MGGAVRIEPVEIERLGAKVDGHDAIVDVAIAHEAALERLRAHRREKRAGDEEHRERKSSHLCIVNRRARPRRPRTVLSRCRYNRRHALEATSMPSFDIVSEVDKHELTNAVDQATRELSNRFDFKGVDATFELDDNVIMLSAPSDFQLKQMLEILRQRLTARKIDVRALDAAEPEVNLASAKQKVTVKQGIEQAVAKKIIGQIKAAKIKVETQINGDKLRVSGKKRDDLQLAMALLRKSDIEVPLQFDNFRD
jgi:uncharacterized protein YajQ (UPF0234 family)